MSTTAQPYLTLIEGRAKPLSVPAATTVFAADRGAEWRREVSRVNRLLKHQLGLPRKPLRLKRGSGCVVQADGIAGVIPVAGHELIVLPKFLTDDAADSWRLAMDRFVTRVRERDRNLLRANRQGIGYVELRECIALAFGDALMSATRHDPLVGYVTATREQRALRGQILIPQLVQRVISRPGQFVCRVPERSVDNDLNRLLHWAANRILGWEIAASTKRLVGQAIGRLPPVPARRGAPRRPLVVPRHHAAWRDAVEIANNVLLDSGRALGGDGSGYGYVVNTAYAFEGFVEKTLTEACERHRVTGFTCKPQHRRLFASAVNQQARPYCVQPDNVIYQHDAPLVVIDAKYKIKHRRRGRSRPGVADLYQVYTATRAFGVKHGALIYPAAPRTFSSGQASRWRAWQVTDSEKTQTVIGVFELNLSLLADSSGLTALEDSLILNVCALLNT
jgi:5-methylcytosine-specific restriction endonuclease McrBC regulatory subunit McrC